MKCNVGSTERVARAVIGIALLVVGFLVPMAPVWQTVVFVLAAVALVTALVQFCPAWAIFGVNTCKPDTRL